MSKNKKTFWPYGILLSLLAIIVACVATIMVASNHPVYEDDFYFDSYQNVENNYNEIQINQATFDKFFSVNLDLNSSKDKKGRVIYNLNQNEVHFIVTDKIKGYPKNLHAELLLTRPHTSKQDEKIKVEVVQDSKTIDKESLHKYFIDVKLPKIQSGRWQLKLKISADEISTGDNQKAIGFYIYEIFAH